MWRIMSESPDNNNNNNNNNNKNNKSMMSKPKLIPRFIETKDRYWVNTYGPLYRKTMTLVGFDRQSTSVTLPNRVVPRLIEWDSKVQYEVDGKILQQPRDWANILTTSSGGGAAGGDDEGEEDDENNNNMASMGDIKSQISTPYILNSYSASTSSSTPSPATRRTNSLDTPANASFSTTLSQTSPPTQPTIITPPPAAKKGRNM